MEKRMFTCPMTGVEFEAMSMEPYTVPFVKMVTHHPLKHEPVEMYLNERWEICIPLRYFDHIKTVTPIEASEILGVSRQRIAQILSDNIINSHTVNGSSVFLLDDVLAYKESRQPGRPRKEVCDD